MKTVTKKRSAVVVTKKKSSVRSVPRDRRMETNEDEVIARVLASRSMKLMFSLLGLAIFAQVAFSFNASKDISVLQIRDEYTRTQIMEVRDDVKSIKTMLMSERRDDYTVNGNK